MLAKMARLLHKATADPKRGSKKWNADSRGLENMEESSSDLAEEDDDADASSDVWSPESPQYESTQSQTPTNQATQHVNRGLDQVLPRKARRDLRAAKVAGFRVSCIGNVSSRDCFVSISCRVAKLMISEEALQAWHMDRERYVVLLIHYTAGYKTLGQLIEGLPLSQRSVEMRIGTSRDYHIKMDEALTAFSSRKEKRRGLDDFSPRNHEVFSTKATNEDTTKSQEFATVQSTPKSFQPLFISRPLNELLNDRLLAVIRYRLKMNISWDKAEESYIDLLGRSLDLYETSNVKSSPKESATQSNHIKSGQKSSRTTADHLQENSQDFSFPLVAMQFALRHLVRCTEFCLVCHRRIDANFEALKPYVCSKPLCLYQYMALGFGPSIEHEVLSQPYVVDLLISFCYASASAERLRTFPLGLGLAVPSTMLASSSELPKPGPATLPVFPRLPYGTSGATPPAKIETHPPSTWHKAKFDQRYSELLFQPGETPLKTGDWIVLAVSGSKKERQHHRVESVLYPTVRLGPAVIPATVNTFILHTSHGSKATSAETLTPTTVPPSPAIGTQSLYLEVEFALYDQTFDDLSDRDKQSAIVVLLNTLPSVRQIQAYLQDKDGSNMSLLEWRERISPAALGVLRWIIASNTSCIVEIDDLDGNSRQAEDRVSGMKSWMQFRFAQGAPGTRLILPAGNANTDDFLAFSTDKEQKFLESLRSTRTRLNLKYPTLFAWHGSPLFNWHGIIREGLHFKEVTHGRAFGDGVYHSLDASTSLSYAGIQYSQYPRGGAGSWPQSLLKISAALSLNEIIAATDEYRCKTPHLVVTQLDWIQTRYLFVKCDIPEDSLRERPCVQAFDQDASFTPKAPDGRKIVLPITAISGYRRNSSKSVKNGHKKAKVASPVYGEIEYVSDDTDVEDRTMLLSDVEEMPSDKRNPQVPPMDGTWWGESRTIALTSKTEPQKHKTDFVPASLDQSSLTLLASPSYATPMATKALQRELQSTLKVQEAHPAHQLGWYINPDLVSNVYQWIVELHSFDEGLPLTKEMKEKALTSIVLEIRFGSQYPMSPPFVRVIRPRFLPFMAGGGGHVTAGGALCMELLTNDGWSSANNIESVLLQVRMAISSTEPKPARLETGRIQDYGVGEAIEAFKRACRTHGVGDTSLALDADIDNSLVAGTQRFRSIWCRGRTTLITSINTATITDPCNHREVA